MSKSSQPPTPPAPENPPQGVNYIISITSEGDTQAVTFHCLNCGKVTTRTSRPGHLPKWCTDCAPIIQRQKTIEGNKRRRAEKKAREG